MQNFLQGLYCVSVKKIVRFFLYILIHDVFSTNDILTYNLLHMAIILMLHICILLKLSTFCAYLHMPLYNIMLCPIKSSQIYNWFVKKQRAFQNCTFQGSIRESETFIKVKVLRYLNNTHGIIDIVLCWSINMNYCYSLFYIYSQTECSFSVTVFLQKNSRPYD